MRVLWLGLSMLAAVFGFVAGCGDTDSDDPNGGGSAGQSVSGAAGMASAGRGGSASAGASSAGAASGAAAAGSSASGGTGSSSGSGGIDPGDAGGPSNGGSGSLSECNPTKVVCKALAPACPAEQVPSVEGGCWGDCVAIAQCACSQASDCPNNDEYTCWSKRHCGPYVR